MGDIVQLHGDPHQQVQQLLPWFVNGTLDAAEHCFVDEHVAACAECASDLAHERNFANAYVSLDAQATNGWAALRDRAVVTQAARRRGGWHGFTSQYGRFAAVAASQLLLVMASVGAYRFLSEPAQPVYHVLGANSATLPPEGNMVVIFRPDVTEQSMRTTLLAARARIVNGPTKASGYVLAVAPAERTRALDLLRNRSEILLAQPIDGASRP